MHLTQILVGAAALLPNLAVAHPEARASISNTAVDQCQQDIRYNGGYDFCKTFFPTRTVTVNQVVYKNGGTTTICTTKQAPCTTTPPSYHRKREAKVDLRDADKGRGQVKCNRQGVPYNLQKQYSCDVIEKACRQYYPPQVQTQTSTITEYKPLATVYTTKTVTPACSSTTAKSSTMTKKIVASPSTTPGSTRSTTKSSTQSTTQSTSGSTTSRTTLSTTASTFVSTSARTSVNTSARTSASTSASTSTSTAASTSASTSISTSASTSVSTTASISTSTSTSTSVATSASTTSSSSTTTTGTTASTTSSSAATDSTTTSTTTTISAPAGTCLAQVDAFCQRNSLDISQTCCAGTTCVEAEPNLYRCRPGDCKTKVDDTCVPNSSEPSETCCENSGNTCQEGPPNTYFCRPAMPTVCKSQIDAICVPNTAIFSETCCVSSGNTCQETTPNNHACRPAICQIRTDATCVPDSTVLSETCCPESGNVCTPGTPGTYSCRPEMFVCQNGRPGSSTGNKNKIDITCNQRYTTIGNGGNNNAVINEQLTATVQQCGNLCAANGNCNNINYFRQTSTSGSGRPMLCQQLYTRDFGLVDDDGVDSGSKTA